MAVLFISDLHLSPDRQDIAQNLMSLLRQAHTYEHIYILGDLFDFWLGDDAIPDAVQPLISALQTLTQSGIKIFFVQGNRDFLVGEQFMRQTGCTLLDDVCVVEHFGQRLLIMHGDTLCTDDVEYQQFRTFVRDPQRQKQFLALPLDERIKQVKEVRQNVQDASSGKAEEIMDVNQDTVKAEMEKHNVSYLIHGHTHRPAIHKTNAGWRAVIGDWHPQASWLVLNEKGITLHDSRVPATRLSANF